MKKSIKITESNLIKIIKKVIKENEGNPYKKELKLRDKLNNIFLVKTNITSQVMKENVDTYHKNIDWVSK